MVTFDLLCRYTDALVAPAVNLAAFDGRGLGYRGICSATSSGVRKRAPYSLSSCATCFRSAVEQVTALLERFRLCAGELMGRKASSNPAGVNRASTRSRGERITNACGLNLGINTHSPAFTLKAFVLHTRRTSLPGRKTVRPRVCAHAEEVQFRAPKLPRLKERPRWYPSFPRGQFRRASIHISFVVVPLIVEAPIIKRLDG